MILLPMLALAASGPISVEVAVAKKGTDDILAIRLINGSKVPVTFEYSESPCSSTELATVAFQGEGAIGFPLERVGLIDDPVMRKQTIAPKGTYSCTFSISHWYWERWKPQDRSKITIFWSFEPSADGIYDRRLYGGAVKLP